MGISIAPATLRDATYIIANLRPADRHEAFCQLPEGIDDTRVAYFLLMNGEAFAARWTDREGRQWPCVFFGVQPMNAVALAVWALGTKHARRAIPAVTRFMGRTLLPQKIAQGYRIMEARSIDSHHEAHQWMEATGARRVGEPFVYGRDGELFHLYRWKAEDHEAYLQRYGNVIPHSE